MYNSRDCRVGGLLFIFASEHTELLFQPFMHALYCMFVFTVLEMPFQLFMLALYFMFAFIVLEMLF